MSFLCGQRKPTDTDLQVVAEFGQWLADHPRPSRPQPSPVRRPQACNCGANTLISVAHLDTCASRTGPDTEVRAHAYLANEYGETRS